MPHPLDKIESSLRRLLEDSVGFLPWNNPDQQLIHHLVRAVHNNLTRSQDNQWIAPSDYIIFINPNSTTAWQANADGLKELARSLEESVRQAGIQFIEPPVLHVSLDDSLVDNELHVEVSPSSQNSGFTTATPTLLSSTAEPELPPGACLITPDEIVFHLQQPVINIGRRSDNHLIIDDPRISRTHAQLRASHGKYMILDLNSTGGTYVNGERVTRLVLQPGDVISLSGIPLIYNQDPGGDQ